MKIQHNITTVIKNLILFEIGGLIYNLIEMLYRGNTHWTMFILGGLCFVSIGLINNAFSWKNPIEIQCLIGGGIITLLEYITGYIVNIKLGWNVWDYSNIPLNLQGQICLPFTVVWIVLSLFIIIIDDFLRWKFFKEDKPKYYSICLDITYEI